MAAAVSMLLVAASALANTLQSVKVGQGGGQAQVLTIALSEGLTSTPMHFTTTNPHRIVIDLPGIQNPQGRASETVNTGVIRGYNIAQTADRTRVVVDLTGPATYDLKNEGNRVLVTLRGSDNAPGTAAPAHFDSSPSASSATASVQDVVFRRGKNSESRVEVALSDPGVGVDIKQKGKTIQVDFLNTALPQNLMRRLDVSEFATPAQSIETFTQGTNTRMVVTPKGKWDYFAYQTGKTFILEVTPIDAGDKASGKKRYDGERLSLDFQDVDVRAVLKVIADFTGLNIVAAESVKGSVTVRLKDVPWDQALDIILLTKGLDKRENGNVIWVAPSKEMADKEKERMDAAEIEELQTEIVHLNYMRAPDAYAILTGKSITSVQAGEKVTCSTAAQGVGGRKENTSGSTGNSGAAGTNSMLSKRGTVNFDLKTNSVFIQDTAARIEKMKTLLSEIDVPARQVMIEARIVVADDSFSRSLGARLGFKARVGKGFGISSDANDAFSMASGGLSSTSTTAYNVDLGANTTFSTNNAGIIGLSLIDASNAILGLELEALEADNRGKIISNPRVITQNQQPAVILQGQQVPYVTNHGTSETPTTEFKDALLCLLVDPQVLNNDDIILNVEVQKDAPVALTGGSVRIDTKRLKTQVRVKNGETVVLGGIFEQEQANNTEKIPLLGDIPVLGLLFRNNYKTDAKTELMVFLTPRLLNDAVSLK
ncbi:type IV pilus secretin PilQ [Parasulfuritortus cantonensis]|nr:type IV pilus secretin PilQ [Parasulfuritortus cantonensis]